jgi:hypothetical protein
MCRIAGNLGFVERQPVRFCSRADIGREWILPKPCYHRHFYENFLEKENP